MRVRTRAAVAGRAPGGAGPGWHASITRIPLIIYLSKLLLFKHHPCPTFPTHDGRPTAGRLLSSSRAGTPTDLLRFNRSQLKYAVHYYRIQKAYANSRVWLRGRGGAGDGRREARNCYVLIQIFKTSLYYYNVIVYFHG